MRNVTQGFGVCVGMALLVLTATACAQLAEQRRATADGISITYVPASEQLASLAGAIYIRPIDGRMDKDVIGQGARPNIGQEVPGYILMGPVGYPLWKSGVSGLVGAGAFESPRVRNDDDIAGMFKAAMAERLHKGGAIVTDDELAAPVLLDLSVQEFKLDFESATWRGHVSYVATVTSSGNAVCQRTIDETAKVINWSGYGSAQKALNTAFSAAINKMDLLNCPGSGASGGR